jgi:hypothetical protein
MEIIEYPYKFGDYRMPKHFRRLFNTHMFGDYRISIEVWRL